MYASKSKWIRLLYLAPALLFVLAFTLYPFLQMAWISLHNWSLMEEPNYIDLVLLLALIIPYQALLTPVFFMFAEIGLHNSLVGLAVVHTAIQLAFSVYIMRNSFEAVPRELEEAAVVDGASTLQLLARIYLPAIKPAIVTVSLFAFIMSWKEFLGALVIMNRGDSFTLPLALATARQQTILGGTDWGMLQAGVFVSIVPCVLFYLLLQKYYVSGFLSGAVK